jgi:hypothetical protein
VKAVTDMVTQPYLIAVVLMQWMAIASSAKRLPILQTMTAKIVKTQDK